MILEDNKLYQVGGFIRDEILGIESVDIDYCYEGDAIKFAHDSGLNIIKENKTFHTVRIKLGEREIDIASTRKEHYPKKGHLPEIIEIGCSIEEDLIRRDFTINALAKRTTDGKIIDKFGGIDDIKEKKLRILHKDSFIDDPTRIIRGLKFSVRLNFQLDEETTILQQKYLSNINYDMSYHRLKAELFDAFSINSHKVFDNFVSQKIYKLLGENQTIPNIKGEAIENLLQLNPCEKQQLVYLSFFDLSKLNLSNAEKKILEQSTDMTADDNNISTESKLIRKLKNLC